MTPEQEHAQAVAQANNPNQPAGYPNQNPAAGYPNNPNNPNQPAGYPANPNPGQAGYQAQAPATVRTLKDRVANLKNTINSQFPSDPSVQHALSGIDAAIADLEKQPAAGHPNPNPNPPGPGPAYDTATHTPLPVRPYDTGAAPGGFPKTMVDSTSQGRQSLRIDNAGQEEKARAMGYK